MRYYDRNNMNLGAFTLFALGGFLLWRNRFRVQEFLESRGINTPWMREDMGEAVRSGAAKIRGRVRHGFGRMDRDIRNPSGDVVNY